MTGAKTSMQFTFIDGCVPVRIAGSISEPFRPPPHCSFAPAATASRTQLSARVHDLPDFVYFNHSIHVNKGVGCRSCHGPVDEMPLMYAENTLQMEWCLSCHRAPEQFLRPKEKVFDMNYRPPDRQHPVTWKNETYYDQEKLGIALAGEYHLRNKQDITSCSTCHR